MVAMSLLWMQSVLMNALPLEERAKRVANWPDKVHVTQAGFSGHVDSPVLKSFLNHRPNQDDAWYKKEDVDISKPMHSWQPVVLKKHVLKYLRHPSADIEKVKRDGYSDGYAGDDHPTAIRWQGRHIVTDGSHRVAAEMLRGTNPKMKMWVYDADKHGFPKSIAHDPPSDYPPPRKHDDFMSHPFGGGGSTDDDHDLVHHIMQKHFGDDWATKDWDDHDRVH